MHDSNERHEELLGHRRHPEHVRAQRHDVLVAVCRDPYYSSTAGDAFLDIGYGLVVDMVGRHDRDDREAGLEKGDRAMLHLSCRIGLGVEVADLLELQGSFCA